MAMKINKNTRDEIINALKERYKKSKKKEKKRILDEFTAVSGYHRKHAARLLGSKYQVNLSNKKITSKRIYDDAVKDALIIVWETADRICSKRLKAAIPDLIDAMERHNHLKLDPILHQRLLKISASSIDRLLSEVRKKARPYKKKRKSSKKVNKQIPIRTFADWDDPVPGFLEIDFVAHHGGSMHGNFIHTFVGTDVCSGWTECIPLIAREQSIVVEALEVLRNQLPIPLLGIDCDNDSAFINDTLLTYCRTNGIKFTRSRPYRSNDQAWVEQKNSAVVRRFVGYERFAGVVAGQALAHLYQNIRLYVNYFQPSFKLLEKEHQTAKIRRIYDKPTTPYNRLINHPTISGSEKNSLRLKSVQLDPVYLLHQIRDKQSALAALTSPDYPATGPGRKSLEEFLAQLPNLWKFGDARPTHSNNKKKVHYWRTRKDPFEEVWPDVLQWLQKEPENTAKELFQRLQGYYPGRFSNGQLRTLQRRIKEWRHIMARNLVYLSLDLNSTSENIVPIGVKKDQQLADTQR
jgi:hypothetical protein